MTTTFAPDWRLSGRGLRLATIGVCALAAAIVTGRGVVVILAAGPLAILAAGLCAAPPEAVTVTVDLDSRRSVEGDPIRVTVTVAGDPGLDRAVARLIGPPSVAVIPETSPVLTARAFTVTGNRWGTPALRLRVRLHSGFQLRVATEEIDVGSLTVLPRPPRIAAAPTTSTVPARLGEHASRAPGPGIEFAGIREYVPGDQLRDLNWSATSRRRRLLVNERTAERAADLIIGIDTFSDVTRAGRSTLDASVRAATALTATALRHRDRVGLLAFGGIIHWLSPAAGTLQFYRIADAVLSARTLLVSVVAPTLDRLPGPVLPPRAHVVVLSPLVDERIGNLLADLARRPVHTSVIDVLGMPVPDTRGRHPRHDPLAVRLWRLDRRAARLAINDLGIPVYDWPPGGDLNTTIARMARHRRMA